MALSMALHARCCRDTRHTRSHPAFKAVRDGGRQTDRITTIPSWRGNMLLSLTGVRRRYLPHWAFLIRPLPPHFLQGAG